MSIDLTTLETYLNEWSCAEVFLTANLTPSPYDETVVFEMFRTRHIPAVGDYVSVTKSDGRNVRYVVRKREFYVGGYGEYSPSVGLEVDSAD